MIDRPADSICHIDYVWVLSGDLFDKQVAEPRQAPRYKKITTDNNKPENGN
jgi:hypothetical protein